MPSDTVIRASNRAACQQHAARLFSGARSLPPPESEELAAAVMASCCVLEEVVARSSDSVPIVAWHGERLSEQTIAALFHATLWALIALRMSERREDDEDLIIACTHLVGELAIDADFEEDISRVIHAGGANFLALKLHARYLDILGCRKDGDPGFIPLLPLLIAAYRQVVASL